MQVAKIGLDLAKHVFRVHGIEAAEKVVVRKAPPLQSGDGVLRGPAFVPDRRGSLYHGALLGTRTDEARP
jgi:hypothetical protein